MKTNLTQETVSNTETTLEQALKQATKPETKDLLKSLPEPALTKLADFILENDLDLYSDLSNTLLEYKNIGIDKAVNKDIENLYKEIESTIKEIPEQALNTIAKNIQILQNLQAPELLQEKIADLITETTYKKYKYYESIEQEQDPDFNVLENIKAKIYGILFNNLSKDTLKALAVNIEYLKNLNINYEYEIGKFIVDLALKTIENKGAGKNE